MQASANMDFTAVYKGTMAQWSPDSKYLAAASQNRLLIRHSDSSDLAAVFTCGDKIERIEWSPDSAYILTEVARQGIIQIWSLADENWKCCIDEGLGGIARAKWAPSSRHIFVVSDFQLYLSVWKLESSSDDHHSSIRIKHPKFARRGVAFSHNGRWLAVLKRINCRDVVAVHDSEDQFAQLAEFQVDADSADLAWAHGDRALVLWERPTKESRFLWFSPSGELLGQASDAGLLRSAWASRSALFLMAGGFDGRMHLVSGASMKTLACFSHDLKTCIAEAGETEVVVLQEEFVGAGIVARHLHARGGASLSVSQSAANEPSGSVRYVRVENLGSFRVPEDRAPEPALDADGLPRQGVGSAFWSPDDRYVATKHDGMPTAIWIWDLGRLCLAALLLHRSPVRSFCWDVSKHAVGDSCRLAISTADPFLFLWSASEAAATPCPFSQARLQWRGDGRAVLLQERDRNCVCSPGPPPVQSEVQPV